ncbi:MAG: glycosyltransferase family 4 protein [Deltaproteobacteria bacterium]
MEYILPFAIAFTVAFFTTPLVRKLAFKIGAVDVPKDERRMHNKPLARLGGLAIFIGFIVSILYIIIVNYIDTGITKLDSRFEGLLIGSFIIICIGIIDDARTLKPWVKMIFQVIAALIVVLSGITIEEITNPFSASGFTALGFLAVPLTVIWIVGITNAINFIDGLDGLAAGVSSIAMLALLFISIFEQQYGVVSLIAALAGATLGFLPFNFNPAKIFMGDTGSNFLGFALAAVSVMGMMKSYATIAISVPLLILALPIFDTAFAILRRLFNGKPIMQADRGHLHHRLIDMGFSQKQTVIVLYIISGFLGICAIELATKGVFRAIILLFSVAVFVIAGAKYMEDMNEEKSKDKPEEHAGK